MDDKDLRIFEGKGKRLITFLGDYAERCTLLKVTDNGDMLSFKFTPTAYLRFKYGLKGLGDSILYTMDYPKKMCRRIFSEIDNYENWIILLTFDGRIIKGFNLQGGQ